MSSQKIKDILQNYEKIFILWNAFYCIIDNKVKIMEVQGTNGTGDDENMSLFSCCTPPYAPLKQVNV